MADKPAASANAAQTDNNDRRKQHLLVRFIMFSCSCSRKAFQYAPIVGPAEALPINASVPLRGDPMQGTTARQAGSKGSIWLSESIREDKCG
jgi:hypothetical protein